MSEALSRQFERCYTSAVHDVMRRHGRKDFVLPWDIKPLFLGSTVAGPAFTFRGRVDPTVDPHDTYLAWTKVLGDIPPGSIGVCQPNDARVAHMGELSAETLKLRGIKGYVVDGGCRDVSFIRRLGFPVWCRYHTPADIVGYWIPEGFGEPVKIGTVSIEEGDYLFADDDGIVSMPAQDASLIAAESESLIRQENLVRKAILDGMHPQQAYITYGKF